MRRPIRWTVVFIAIATLLIPIFSMISNVNANGDASLIEHKGGGFGGDIACGEGTFTNCGYGGWRFYVFDDKWDDSYEKLAGVIKMSEAVGVKKDGNTYYFLGATNGQPVETQEIDCSGLSQEPDGIYRYSILSQGSLTHQNRAYQYHDDEGNVKTYSPGISFSWSKGDQVGVQKPCMNAYWGTSVGCYGYQNKDADDEDIEADWGSVVDWKDVEKAYVDDFGGTHWGSDMEVGLFCGALPGVPKKRYFACESFIDEETGREYESIYDLSPAKRQKYKERGKKKFIQNSDGGDWQKHKFSDYDSVISNEDLDAMCPTDSYVPDPDNPNFCPNSGNQLYNTSFLGQTGGVSAVSRANARDALNNNWVYANNPTDDSHINATNGSAYVYARPGQYLRFRHEYCYGSQNVVYNNIPGQAKTKQAIRIDTDDGFEVSIIGRGEKVVGFGNSPGVFTTTDIPESQKHNVGGQEIITQNNYVRMLSKNQGTNNKLDETKVGSYYHQKMWFQNVVAWTKHWTETPDDPTCPSTCTTSNSKTGEVFTADTFEDAELYYLNGLRSGKWNSTKKIKNYTDWCTNPTTGRIYRCGCSGCGSITENWTNNVKKLSYVKDDGRVTKDVYAVVPYNFDTKVKAKIGSDDTHTVNAGESINLGYEVKVLKRANQDVDGSTPYKTHTPSNTKVQMVYFIIPSDADITDPTYNAIRINANKLQGSTNTRASDRISDVCDYYERQNLASGSHTTNSINCTSITNDDTFGTNREFAFRGSINTETDSIARHYNNAPVPDSPGAKFCVAAGIYPADSHNRPTSEDDPSIGEALASGANELNGAHNGQEGKVADGWRISGAVCATIAKKANSQVWGSIYTNGGVDALISHKLNTTNPGTYGSWADTSIIAQKGVELMASAAAIGYSDTLKYPGGNGGSSPFGYCSDMPGNSWNPRLSLTLLTVGRLSSSGSDNCNNDKISTTDDIGVTDRTASYRELLRDRFTDDKNIKNSLTIDNWDEAEDESHVLRKYKYTDDSGSSKTVTTRVINSSGTVTLKNIQVPENQTLVINANTEVRIEGNICYGAGNCKNANELTDTRLKDRNNQSFSSISALPQVLIFSKGEIKITKNVRQVDAWLIGNGKLNTCHRDDAEDVEMKDSDGTVHTVSNEKAEDCAALLMINGPVLTNNVDLRRSGGAFSNSDVGGVQDQVHSGIEHNLNYDGSVTPAEILNLRPDVYLWSYYQAQQNTQAVSSYTRELAPRL